MLPKIMIAIDPDALEALHKKLDKLTAEIRAVKMTPAPEWLPAADYAKQIGAPLYRPIENLLLLQGRMWQ